MSSSTMLLSLLCKDQKLPIIQYLEEHDPDNCEKLLLRPQRIVQYTLFEGLIFSLKRAWPVKILLKTAIYL